jgi:hypothetical protein
MDPKMVAALKLVVVFLLSGVLLGAGILTYWGLGLAIGLLAILVSVGVVSWAGYETYRLAAATRMDG